MRRRESSDSQWRSGCVAAHRARAAAAEAASDPWARRSLMALRENLIPFAPGPGSRRSHGRGSTRHSDLAPANLSKKRRARGL